jgi:hypothetical protein
MSTEQAIPAEQDERADVEQNGVTPRSILDDVRAIREAKIVEQEPRLVANVPLYDDRLAVIYTYPADGAERAVAAVEREMQSKDFEGRLDGASKLLVIACAAVVGRDVHGKLVDLVTGELLGPDDKPELPSAPMRFDRTLAERLAIDVPEDVKGVGRFVCRQVFSPKGLSQGVYEGDLALIATSNAVYAWLSGARAKADEDAAGE